MYKGYPLFVLTPGMRLLLAIAIIWSLVWKGIALWKAGQNGSRLWFVVLFLVNTLGILDIIYIYAFAKRKI
jgi:hypothetical protein